MVIIASLGSAPLSFFITCGGGSFPFDGIGRVLVGVLVQELLHSVRMPLKNASVG
jgi:hypothetical protein